MKGHRAGLLLTVVPVLAFHAALEGSAAGPAGPAGRSVAPVKAEEAVSVHSPYGTGDCALCHEGKDAKAPGKAIQPVNDTCFACHEDMHGALAAGKYRHAAAEKDCTSCHNPHSSKLRQLLVAPMPDLCTGCHAEILRKMESKVRHDALTTGRSCSSCHSPHASNVEKVLLRLPFDLCVECHSVDGLKDSGGKSMTDFGKLLAENPVHHAPIASKDCSSCHEPHGSEHTRMSIAEYPPQFYATFDPASYALCFSCHDERLATQTETTTDTRFRDGSRNLHFLHVNKAAGRGRTCRACHEVHASKQAFLVRENVPFGPKGWLLNVGFRKDPNGGTCDRTCHASKSYVHAAPVKE